MRMKKISIDVVAPQMAEALLALTLVHHKALPQVRWNLAKGMCLMIRDLERHVQHRVSIGAARRATQMGISDLHSLEWRHQPTKMKDEGRKIFHWEHVEQAVDIRNAILALAKPDEEQIKVLLKRTSLAWILKSENEKLPKGARANAFELYRSVGIEFVPLP